jgi:hypothetical protein
LFRAGQHSVDALRRRGEIDFLVQGGEHAGSFFGLMNWHCRIVRAGRALRNSRAQASRMRDCIIGLNQGMPTMPRTD